MKVLIFLYLICSASGPLPKNARRVSSCPEPKNLTAWRSAAKRLNCSEYRFSRDIIEKKHFYHCLPSGFVNETIEFCGPTTAIEKGHCPIYKYEYGATVATSRSCASFTTGCPDPKDSPYHSWTFLNYYDCWNINTEYRCFYAEPNCPREEQNRSDKIEAPISTDETLYYTGTTTMSTNVTSCNCVPRIPSFVVGILSSLLTIFIEVAVGLYIYISKKGRKKKTRKLLDSENIPGTSNEDRIQLTKVVTNPQGTTMEYFSERRKLLDSENIPGTSNEVCIHPKRKWTSNEFKDWLKENFMSMKDDTLEFLKNVLTDFFNENSLRGMDTFTVLDKMSDVIKLEFNMSFLQWIFAEKEEYAFAEKCKTFSPWDKFDITFNMGIIADTNSRYLQFEMNEVGQTEEYPHMIDNLRAWLAELIKVSRGKILMTALEKAPLVVTYRMDLRHAEQILNFLMTDDGQTEAHHKKVKNVREIKNLITIEKPVNGPKFIHLTLKGQTHKLEEGLKKVANTVSQKFGLKKTGREVYLQVRSSDKQGKDSKGDSDFARKFIDKNQKALLGNLEPSILMKKKQISSLFDDDAVEKMSQIGSRGEKVAWFLQLCNNLSEDDFKMIVPYLEDYVPASKTDACDLQVDQIRNSINKNRGFFLEEIDKDFVETTLSKIGSISSDIETLWNGSKPRKEKVGNFLDFVLTRDDYLQAFKKTMEEMRIEIK